jgi:hypothetical protein
VPDNLFLVRRSSFDNSITRFANPSAPFPKTVAYELGYEQNLFDEYLLRVAGYYKDVTNETYLVNYISSNSSVNYSTTSNNRYRDIRGFEVTVTKNRGNWFQGFANYTYDVRTTGFFGYPIYYQSAQTQADYIVSNWASFYQSRPLPQPYARLNLDFFTPPDFGPDVAGEKLLADWRLNLVGSWSSGTYLSWIGGGSRPDIANNFQWTDFMNFDMRITKTFHFGKVNLQLFADVSNLFNFKYMSPDYGFVDANDFNDYMKSLHLPAEHETELGYINISGDDKPGMYRKAGVDFQPIVALARYTDLASPSNQQARPFYYVKETRTFYQLVNGTWQQVDQGRLNKVLDDKAYIDMPNLDTFTFLNPRRIYYGIRLGFDL